MFIFHFIYGMSSFPLTKYIYIYGILSWEYLGYEGFPWDKEVYPYWNIYIWIDTNSVCIYIHIYIYIYIYINIWDMRYSQQPWWFLMVAYPWEDPPVFRRGGHGLQERWPWPPYRSQREGFQGTSVLDEAKRLVHCWDFHKIFIGINGI